MGWETKKQELTPTQVGNTTIVGHQAPLTPWEQVSVDVWRPFALTALGNDFTAISVPC